MVDEETHLVHVKCFEYPDKCYINVTDLLLIYYMCVICNRKKNSNFTANGIGAFIFIMRCCFCLTANHGPTPH